MSIAVVAAAIVDRGRLLVVSKKDAPGVFYLPGGKPERGEPPARTLARELDEELGVTLASTRLLATVHDIAALERVPMRMTVYLATMNGVPEPAAELAALGWTNGCDAYRPLLAPAVRNQVLPRLIRRGALGPC